jgi:hypothetical protein
MLLHSPWKHRKNGYNVTANSEHIRNCELDQNTQFNQLNDNKLSIWQYNYWSKITLTYGKVLKAICQFIRTDSIIKWSTWIESLIIIAGLVVREARELNFHSTKYISSESSCSCISTGQLVPIFPEISEVEQGVGCYQNNPAPLDGTGGTQQTPAQNLTASHLFCSCYCSVLCVKGQANFHQILPL